MATVKTFEDLNIWTEGIEIAVDIYKLTRQGEIAKDYGLRDQVRRSAVSVPANIAEGFEYDNAGDFVRYLKYSKGSTGELRSHLTILEMVGYIDRETSIAIKERLKIQARKTGKLITYLKNTRKNNP